MTPPIITPELRCLAEGIANAIPMEAANDEQPRKYMVFHKCGREVIAQFEVEAIDSLAAATDNPAPEGCHVKVLSRQAWDEQQALLDADEAINRQKNNGQYEREREERAYRDDPLSAMWERGAFR
jgi:hypothetical protein